VNLKSHIKLLLRDLYISYCKGKISEKKFCSNVEKLNSSNFSNKKFDGVKMGEYCNFYQMSNLSNNFLLKKETALDNPFPYLYDETPSTDSIKRAIDKIDLKKVILRQSNFKDQKLKELKPSKINLSKIPLVQTEDMEIDEEYRQYLKPSTLVNKESTLSKDTFLNHKRRRSSGAKPTKSHPSHLIGLVNQYQDVFANVKLTTVEKYLNMQKYKETISN